MDISIVPVEVQDKIREYFKTSSLEMGCLITKDWQVIPFENCAEEGSKRALIKQLKDDDVITMMRLLEQDNLFAWVHSHPAFSANPSGTDVWNHHVPCHMIIWSGVTDSFGIWSAEEISAMREKDREVWTNFASDWKGTRRRRVRGVLDLLPREGYPDGYPDDDTNHDDGYVGDDTPLPGQGWVCYSTSDPDISFDLTASSVNMAVREALERLGWVVTLEDMGY